MTEPNERKFASIRDYSKSRGLQPQLVHYYVRRGEVEAQECPCCGCKVIKIEEADKVLVPKPQKGGK